MGLEEVDDGVYDLFFCFYGYELQTNKIHGIVSKVGGEPQAGGPGQPSVTYVLRIKCCLCPETVPVGHLTARWSRTGRLLYASAPHINQSFHLP